MARSKGTPPLVRVQPSLNKISFHFMYLGFPFFFFFSFFKFSLVNDLLVLFIFSKNKFLVSLIFCFCFVLFCLDSIPFISSMIFIISVLVLIPGLVYCTFSTLLGVWLDCILEIFLSSRFSSLILWISLLELLLLCYIDFVLLGFHFHFSQGNFWFLLWSYC